MIDDEMLQRLLNRTLARGGEYADIFVEQRRSTVVHLEDNKIERVLSGSVAGIGIRLIYEGRTAYAYSNDFSEANLLSVAETVSAAAALKRETPAVNLKKRYPDVSFFIRLLPEAVPLDAKIALVRRANEAARTVDPRIRQVTAGYRDSVQKVKIACSDGFIAEDERVHTLGYVQVVAADGALIQTGYEPVGGHIGFELFEQSPLETAAAVAARRAALMLGARRAPGGRMPVVISSVAGGTMIHEAIGHGLEADLAQRGLSVYSGKKGHQVASPAITVIDDATLPYKRGSFRFDDEGTPARKNILVKEGILQGYLYDRATAAIDGSVSTGNGRRESYENKPIPRMTNTFIAPGTLTPEEVITSVQNGLLVKKMGGGQVNTVTGDFVFDVQEGYLIGNGAVLEPVRGATLTGNGPAVLQSIDLVASDLGFSIGTCGKDSQGAPVSDAMPTLRVPEMVVGGEVA